MDLVEGGTQEVGAFLATHPLLHLGTLGATVAMVVWVLYVAGDVSVRDPLLGSDRVDWSAPAVALSQVTVCFGAMAVGAAPGDILPGA